ncbi:MAG: DUF5985 family protein [Steroidobacteraceae bacterium]
MLGEAVYALCGITSTLCAVLLWRGWRATGAHLLFWASLCFVGLAINNILVILDFVFLPTVVDLYWYRTPFALAGMLVLVYGLVREAR